MAIPARLGAVTMLGLLALAAPLAACAASPVERAPGLSWQGYTGLFNIPHARVTPFGVATIGYSTQVELVDEYRSGSNYLLSLGLLPNLEINGRIATTDNERNFFTNPSTRPQIRDLSFNGKFRLPLPLAWPDVALGVQDPAGETQDFAAEYAVATQQWGPVDLTLGVGRSDSRIGRLDGAFGGIEWAATEWLDVLVEHDAHAANAGVRLHHATRIAGVPLRFDLDLQATTSASDQDGTFAGLSVSLPLGGRTQTTPLGDLDTGVRNGRGEAIRAKETGTSAVVRTGSQDGSSTSSGAAVASAGDGAEPGPDAAAGEDARRDATSGGERTSDGGVANEPLPGSTETPPMTALLGRLERHGFEHISIGRDNDVLHVRAENTVYNRNEVDGLGVILGESAKAAAGRFERVRVVLLNAGVPVIGVEAGTRVWHCYLGQCPEGTADPAAARASLRTFDPGDDDSVIWRHTDVNSATLHPRLILSPTVVTGVATEVGVLDYSLGLRGELRVPLWLGAQAVATGIAPFMETEDFEPGGIFEDAALESGLRDLVLQQALPLGPATLQASVGQFRFDHLGGLAEGLVQFGDGRHRLTGKLGRFENQDIDNAQARELALGSYRHYIPRLDTSIEVTAGRFWGQDEGAMVETHHLFGDTTISLFYRDTVGEFVGIRATIPLTPRRDMEPGLFQLRGAPRWRYNLRTRVGQDRNTVDFATGDTLRRDSGLEQQFFNDDRLNGAYIRRHAARMRAAYRMAQ